MPWQYPNAARSPRSSTHGSVPALTAVRGVVAVSLAPVYELSGTRAASRGDISSALAVDAVADVGHVLQARGGDHL